MGVSGASPYRQVQVDPDLYVAEGRVGIVTGTGEFKKVVPAPSSHTTEDTRESFQTGAVRNDATGKGRFDLLPLEGIQEWAIAMEEGTKSYPDRNWERGIPVGRCLSSALRHIHQYMNGETNEHHLRAALWNIGAAVTIEKRALAGKLPKTLLMDTRGE